MKFLLNKIRALPQYQHLLKELQADGQQPGLGLPRAARLPVLAAFHQDLNRPILLITDRADHALSLFDELGFWVKSPRYHFAEPNPLFYEQAAWGVTTRRERLQTLTALAAYHLPFAAQPCAPPAEKLPLRLVFFGDESATIGRFGPASQRTVETLESILITPAREFIV